jgi:2-(1,2-epoxy-1,2-dihydrophenyl)acetyl-CoA isomerase
VVEDEALQGAADDLVLSLAAGPTGAYGAAKRLLIDGVTSDLATALARESETIAAMAGTADAREGVAAFLQRREPTYVRP